MKKTKPTWIGFLIALSALNIPTKTIAHETNSISEKNLQAIESRLALIAKTLKQREQELSESSQAREIMDRKRTSEIASWGKGYRGGFANRVGGGGFANRHGGGGFVNRRWPDGGGFFNRRF